MRARPKRKTEKRARPKRTSPKVKGMKVRMMVVPAVEEGSDSIHRYYRVKKGDRIYIGVEWYKDKRSRPSLKGMRWYSINTSDIRHSFQTYGISIDKKKEWKKTDMTLSVDTYLKP
jgi:hypothetical protein